MANAFFFVQAGKGCAPLDSAGDRVKGKEDAA
jgi:hypothetical protein